MPDRKVTRNLYFDLFADKYLFHYGMPYCSTAADFVQLNQLTRNGPLAARMTLEVFARGVENYFRSEHGVHTLKQLCSTFVPYWRHPLDRYGKPIEKASQVGGQVMETGPATWHPKFLSAAFRVVQADSKKMDAVEALMDQVADMNEQQAFAALREIEHATANS